MSLYQPLFNALNEANIRYVVVGGLATVLHGYSRMTADIDLIIDLDHDEVEKCIDTLIGLGMKSRLPLGAHLFSDANVRKSWIEDKGMKVFPLWKPDNPLLSVDLFVSNPIGFSELWGRAEIVDLGGQSIRIAAIPDLIKLKKLADRQINREDIKKLKIQNNMTHKNNIKEGDDWQYIWQDHEQAQLRGWLETTPAQRLAWLEESIIIAHKSGALSNRFKQDLNKLFL